MEGNGIAADPKGPLFRTLGRKTKQLTRTSPSCVNAYANQDRQSQFSCYRNYRVLKEW